MKQIEHIFRTLINAQFPSKSKYFTVACIPINYGEGYQGMGNLMNQAIYSEEIAYLFEQFEQFEQFDVLGCLQLKRKSFPGNIKLTDEFRYV